MDQPPHNVNKATGSPHRRIDAARTTSLKAQLSGCSTITSPRSCAEIDAERNYLQTSAEALVAMRANLIAQYWSLITQAQDCASAKERRRIRKRLSLLSERINADMVQERAVQTRINELCMEMQSQELRAIAYQELQIAQEIASSRTSRSSFSHPSDASQTLTTSTTPLNGGSPIFMAQAFLETATPETETKMYEVKLETVEEAGEEIPGTAEIKYEYRDSEHGEKATLSWEGHSLKLRSRCPSLPNLRSFWPSD
ncbi:hypothetical protein B0I35DRAFT_406408 [Stachybotrys elegans]|uniref:Uncharacterized protein n=1 Tax=Stachybotrys elegans TaxID=80388 RepID=A0A8K0SVT3_9HYPO|nr:hypothetical protein B0I35DRAFT_406408 [Stachybotrys elegans]